MKKMRNRKRFVSFILVCAVGVLSFMNMQVYGQEKTKRISLKVANVSVLQALHEVNRLCGNWVMFRTEEVVKEKGRVTVDVKNKSVLEVVKECLKGTALGCVEKDGKIIVTVEGVKTLRITGLVTDGKAPLPGEGVDYGNGDGCQGKVCFESADDGEADFVVLFYGDGNPGSRVRGKGYDKRGVAGGFRGHG